MTFRWPFVSRARHDEMKELTGRLIADRDQRIADLEADRRLTINYLTKMGIGHPLYVPMPEVQAETPEAEGQKKSAKQPEATVNMRPSAIMRRMDRMAEERYLRKVHPSRENAPIAEMLEQKG